jgi:hypothetical protein
VPDITDIQLERLKMYQDSVKHTMTFCSGAILLASAVTGALFLPKPDIVVLLAISILLFAIGAAFAMLALILVPRSITLDTDVITDRLKYLNGMLWLCVGAAYLGISIFAIFAMINITEPERPEPKRPEPTSSGLITTSITAF